MKCLILHYIQLLVIGRAIQAMKVNRNVAKGPLSHQKMKLLIFVLHSTSDDRPSNPGDES